GRGYTRPTDSLGRRSAAQYPCAGERRRGPMTFLLQMLALLGLVLLNGFFVAAEYGLVTSRRTRIMELQHEGNKRADAVLRITKDPPRFIAAMQLGVTISSLAIGALGEQVLAHHFDSIMASFLAVILALLIVTYLHV